MIELLIIQPLPVTEALDTLRAAYTTGTIADRMTYETRRSDGTFDSVSAVLRINSTDAGRQLRYDTSGFAFSVQPGTLIGAGLGPPEPRRVLVTNDEGQSAAQLLTGIIPTGPLPQLWSINGSDATDSALGAIRFTAASTDRGTTTITGDTAFGPVRIQTDANTGRLISLFAALRDGTIELRAAPTEPGDPHTWTIDTDRRRTVTRIDQLAPNLAILGVGDLLPDISLQTASGTGIRLADWHESPPEAGRRSAWSLIMFVDATSIDAAEALRDASGMLDAIKRESAVRETNAAPAERFWLRYRPLIILVMPEDTALNPQRELPTTTTVDVLYSTRPDLTIDRLPLAPIVAVGIDRDRVIGAISAKNNGAEAPSRVDQFVDQLIAPASNADE